MRAFTCLLLFSRIGYPSFVEQTKWISALVVQVSRFQKGRKHCGNNKKCIGNFRSPAGTIHRSNE